MKNEGKCGEGMVLAGKKRKVKVYVRGKMLSETGEDKIELFTDGILWEGSRTLCLLYEETDEDTSEKTKTLIYIKGNCVEVVKRGTVNTRLLFEEGCSKASDYETVYRFIKINTETERLHILKQDEGEQK